jgi:DNA-binding beta-propeller fold protein YncE
MVGDPYMKSALVTLAAAVAFASTARTALTEDSGVGGTPVAQGFQVIVTVSPPGGGSYQPMWRFDVAGTGGAMTQLSDIPASATDDPIGATFRNETELLVGNRHGMSGAGSISRFEFSSDLSTFTQLSTVTGGGLANVHQIALDYTRHELFAVDAAVNTVSRFSYDAAGDFTAIDVIPTSYDGRGVAVSPDGNTLYVSAIETPYIMRFARTASGFTEISPIVVAGGARMHYLKFRNGELFVGDITGAIHRIVFDPDGNPVQKSSLYDSPSPIDMAFSIDGAEMFVANHLVGALDRYLYDEPSDTWTLTSSMSTPPLGGIVTAFGALGGHAPLAADDFYAMTQAGSLDVAASGLLANDSDSDEDPLTVEVVAGPAHASSFAVAPDGSFTYVPLAYFHGEDSFTYRASDGEGYSETATVHITVSELGSQGFITGGGRLSQASGKCTFGFVAKARADGVRGRMEFQDHGAGLNVKSDVMDLVSTTSATDGYFGGTCSVNGVSGYSFFVEVHDRDRAAGDDEFAIWVFDDEGGLVDAAGGSLEGGNVVIHGD